MGLFFAWRWWIERGDKNHLGVRSLEQTQREAMDKAQQSINAEQGNLIFGLRADGKALREELLETRKDRDRGWDLARYWQNTAQDLLQDYKTLRHDALNLEQWVLSAVKKFDLPLPSVEPVPRTSPSIPLGLEDPILRRGKEE